MTLRMLGSPSLPALLSALRDRGSNDSSIRIPVRALINPAHKPQKNESLTGLGNMSVRKPEEQPHTTRTHTLTHNTHTHTHTHTHTLARQVTLEKIFQLSPTKDVLAVIRQSRVGRHQRILGDRVSAMGEFAGKTNCSKSKKSTPILEHSSPERQCRARCRCASRSRGLCGPGGRGPAARSTVPCAHQATREYHRWRPSPH